MTGFSARTGSRWTRWQDWGAVVIGVLIALSPLVTANDTASLWIRVVFGVLLAASGLWSLSQPESVASEYVHIALGVLLFHRPLGDALHRPERGRVDVVGRWCVGGTGRPRGSAAAQATHRGILGQH